MTRLDLVPATSPWTVLFVLLIVTGAGLYTYGVYAVGVVHRQHTRTDLRCHRCQRANRRAAPPTAGQAPEGVISHGCS